MDRLKEEKEPSAKDLVANRWKRRKESPEKFRKTGIKRLQIYLQ
jgi:hypothetical protein